MNDSEQDKEIQTLLASYEIKEIPRKLLTNYENEVMSKVHALESRLIIPVPALALCVTAVGMLALIWYLSFKPAPAFRPAVNAPISQEKIEQQIERQEMPQETPKSEIFSVPDKIEKQNLVSAPVPVQEEAPAQNTAEEEKTFDKMERDLFVLEMLGEDEGLMDDIDRLATDVEFVSQPSPALIG